ncbi:MAG TPA: hypothetical protein VE890_17415 [Thermoguttaceae bacterium]|nr:hypothetical protein [Thermoguttaceae bacterium]
MDESILQFGTGKFLRCFADLFLHESLDPDRSTAPVVALQSTGTERAAQINRQEGRYRVAIRGLEDGNPIDRTIEVCSLSRALTAEHDWQKVLALAQSESLRTILSNTTEAGYALSPDDSADDTPPRSFPAKLVAMLQARHAAGLPGVTLLPCELLDANADRLRGLVLEQARAWRLSDTLIEWIQAECSWHNTLVDRIVSAPADDDPLLAVDPLFAVAEPFALWAIEGSPTVPGLTDHPAIELVQSVEPFALRKVRILNGAHTALVAKSLPMGFQTVRKAVGDAQVNAWLRTLLFDEIVPTLEGRIDGAEQFATNTLERFANPFLDHRLADIALHHDVKLRTRLAPTLDEYHKRFGRVPKLLSEIVGSPSDA